MLTNSKIVLSLALVLATASGAIAAPHKPAVHHQTATARHLPANANLDTRSAASGESVNSVNPCYLKIQTIGNREGNGITQGTTVASGTPQASRNGHRPGPGGNSRRTRCRVQPRNNMNVLVALRVDALLLRQADAFLFRR